MQAKNPYVINVPKPSSVWNQHCDLYEADHFE